MDDRAVKKARERLDRARIALATMSENGTTEQTLAAWTDFLIHANTVYSVLEQGAKTRPQSRQWFGRKKNERRSDQLLQYLHQARNSDEHGIDEIFENVEQVIDFTPPQGEPFKGVIVEWKPGVHIPIDVPPGTKSVQITTSRRQAATVFDRRFGTSCPPPTTHLGQPIAGWHIADLAKSAVAYLEGMIGEAEKLT